MAFRLDARDQQLLAVIAEYRILTVSQFAGLRPRNVRGLRRRLRTLEREGLIRADARSFGGRRGRPEGLFSVCEAGVDVLRDCGALPAATSPECVTGAGVGSIPHLLLTNDFRVQLAQLERLIPAITTRFFSPLSPFLARAADGTPLVRERIEVDPASGRCAEFTPDGVLAVTHAEAGKTLLFYLEVDMGTETLVSERRQGPDFRQKVINYQLLYRAHACRRFEPLVGAPLRGFRLLVLAERTTRMAALSRLVRDMGAPDFVLVTDQHALETRGVWAEIWAPGGRTDGAPVSLLGGRMPRPAPAPAAVP
jgi:hypothetical protein